MQMSCSWLLGHVLVQTGGPWIYGNNVTYNNSCRSTASLTHYPGPSFCFPPFPSFHLDLQLSPSIYPIHSSDALLPIRLALHSLFPLLPLFFLFRDFKHLEQLPLTQLEQPQSKLKHAHTHTRTLIHTQWTDLYIQYTVHMQSLM